MKLTDINVGAPQERVVTVDDWKGPDGEPVKILIRPVTLGDRIAIEESGVKTVAGAGPIVIARCFLDPVTRQPLGTAEDWLDLPMTPGLQRLIEQASAELGANGVEAARKNSKGVRRSRRRSTSDSSSINHSTPS